MLVALPVAPVPGPDQVAYSLAAKWSQKHATLSGSETIRFRNNGSKPLTRVWVRHWPNGWRAVGSSGKPAGCAKAIASLRVTGGGHLGTRTIGCTAYRINLSHAIKPGASGSVRIAFKVRVPRGDDRFGRVGQYTNIGNAVPILAVNDARGWHLDPYSSTGESFYSLSASWNVTLKMPKGGANIAKAAVTLPKTEFLENAHIRTVCTRVQYAAGQGGGAQCPKASVYGFAKAWSPLLDKPIQGPVYLRSSNHELPDLVASLDGQIHVDLQGRIDSVNARIRNTFDFVPDAPVSKFVLTMQGGKKGLLVNNTELCKAKPRADVKFDGQNGKTADSNPLVKADCGKGRKGKKK